MTRLKIVQGIAGAAALAATFAFAVPAMAQSTTYPPGTDCTKFTGAAATACQSQIGHPKNSSDVTGTPNANLPTNGTANPSINSNGINNGTNGTSGTGTNSGTNGAGSAGTGSSGN